MRERIDWRAGKPGIRKGLLCLILSLFFFLFSNNPAISSDHLPVAAIFPKTGITASHNAPLISMTERAVESINNNGGVSEKKRELIVLYNSSTPINSAVAAKKTVNLADFLVESFVTANDSIVVKIQYRRDATDFSDIIRELLEFKPDVTYIPGYTRDSGLFIKQADRQGLTTIFLGGYAWDEISALTGNSIDGGYQTIAWHPLVSNVKSNLLIKLYSDKHGNSLTHFSSPLAYDAVMVLKEALNKCNCDSGEAIRDALYALQAFEGATGAITFNKNGDPANKDIMLV